MKRLVVENSLEQRIMAAVAQRVAGAGAQAFGVKEERAELERSIGGVPDVAGGMRSDRAALRFDELAMLFGSSKRH